VLAADSELGMAKGKDLELQCWAGNGKREVLRAPVASAGLGMAKARCS